ncbi:MAG TPA: hypothetical protein VF555_01930 [Variovorax sp.]
MAKAAHRKATVTLKLPFDIASDAELTALRDAGIPVNDQGVAASGFLHMRTTSDYRSHIFRWFATSSLIDGDGREGAASGDAVAMALQKKTRRSGLNGQSSAGGEITSAA